MNNYGSKFFSLVIFIACLLIYINELKNTTFFLIKYHSIKDSADANLKTCGKIYCEAETARFKLASNMYNLLLPNDLFNCKIYIIIVLIISIFFYIYTLYNMLFAIDSKESNTLVSIIKMIIIIFLLISITLNIIDRYTPYDEQGYKNIFKNENTSINLSIIIIYTIIVSLLVLGVIYINYKKDSKDDIFYYIFIGIWNICAFYLMFTMINIVETFKSNEKTKEAYETEYDLKNHFTADISYNSENYFYDIYCNLRDSNLENIMRFFQYVTEDANTYNIFSYKINALYMLTNLSKISAAFFILSILIMLAIVFYVFIANDTLKKIIDISTPIIYIFFLIIFILIFAIFNTKFNKYVLYGLTSSCYKKDLNDLNNIITPYISMHNNYINVSNDLLLNYIILNVLTSYFKGYTFGENLLEEDNFKKFSDFTRITGNIQFDNEYEFKINDIDDFKSYYEMIYKNKEDIYKYYKDENKNKIKSISDNYSTVHISKLNNIIKYIYINLSTINFDNINSDQKLLLNDIYFFKNKNNKFVHYKFIIDDALFNKTISKEYTTSNIEFSVPIDKYFNILTNIKTDINTLTSNQQNIDMTESFFENIKTCFDLITNTSYDSEKYISYPPNASSTSNLYYIYPEIMKIKIDTRSGDNYLKNIIKNVYNNINDKNINYIIPYNYNINNTITQKTDIDDLHTRELMKISADVDSELKENDEIRINRNNIMEQAYYTLSYDFAFTYFGNLLILIILFMILTKYKSGK